MNLVPLSMLPLPLPGGCYVRLPISEAVAVPAQDNEVAILNEQGERPSTAGKWFKVRATLTRDTVRKIVRWELYTHMEVEDCRTGDVVGGASSIGIEGTEGDFQRTAQQL